MSSDTYKYFRIEARDLVDQLGRDTLELEKLEMGPGAQEVIKRLLRLAHTLKGAARVVKERDIAESAHKIEDVLAPLREGGTLLSQDQSNIILKLLDEISTRVVKLEPQTEKKAESIKPPLERDAPPILRSDVAEMDALLEGVTEASVQLASLRQMDTTLEQARHLMELLDQQLAATQASHHLDGNVPKIQSITAELSKLLGSLERSLVDGAQQVGLELGQLREIAQRLRLLPASLMFGALERTGRDAAQNLGKRITFTLSGGDVRLDAQVLSVVQNALVQAVRNAVAHGIEPAADRLAAGKEASGKLTLEIQRRGSRVAFICKDDGRGIDLEGMRRAMESKGALPADTGKLASAELLQFMLKSGLTTATTTTELAGRGIGLDIIQEAASSLGGEVRVQTEKGIGTTLKLLVPVSLSSLEALLVEVAGQIVAIPLGAIRQTVRVTKDDLSQTAEGSSVLFEGKIIPFAPLQRALHLNADSLSSDTPAKWSAVVIEGASALCALGVDRLLRVETLVMRPLPKLMPVNPVISGTTLDFKGNPQLVLEPDALVKEALHKRPRADYSFVPRLPILVIDDSLTTRMLEQSILESAGYEVDLANSGEEAFEKARARHYALFLVDVEMPGIDGFEFIERMRADPDLSKVPAVLMTSRASPEDRQRGKSVGAAAHIEKSAFDQTKLLDLISRLVSSR